MWVGEAGHVSVRIEGAAGTVEAIFWLNVQAVGLALLAGRLPPLLGHSAAQHRLALVAARAPWSLLPTFWAWLWLALMLFSDLVIAGPVLTVWGTHYRAGSFIRSCRLYDRPDAVEPLQLLPRARPLPHRVVAPAHGLPDAELRRAGPGHDPLSAGDLPARHCPDAVAGHAAAVRQHRRLVHDRRHGLHRLVPGRLPARSRGQAEPDQLSAARPFLGVAVTFLIITIPRLGQVFAIFSDRFQVFAVVFVIVVLQALLDRLRPLH